MATYTLSGYTFLNTIVDEAGSYPERLIDNTVYYTHQPYLSNPQRAEEMDKEVEALYNFYKNF